MKILHYNIGHGTGICKGYHDYILKGWKTVFTNKKILKDIIGFIKSVDPDIVHLVELKKSQFLYLASLLNYPHSFYFIKYAKTIQKVPFMYGGSAVFSKLPLNNKKIHSLSAGVKKKFIQFDIAGASLFFLHLSLGSKTRKKQIIDIMSAIKRNGKKAVVVGDLNTFNGFSELSRLIKQCNLKITNLKHKPTFPSWKAVSELDYILVPKDSKILSFCILEHNSSDHLPIFAEVKL